MMQEMFDVLDFNLSWSNRPLTADDLLKLVDGASIEEIRDRLKLKVEKKRVWDIISNNVLNTPIRWSEISDELSKIKDFRNKAAHFQVITEDEKTDLIATSKAVRAKLTKQKSLNDGQLAILQTAAEAAASILKTVNLTILETHQTNQRLLAKAMADAVRPDLSVMSAALQSIQSVGALSQLKPAQSALSGLTKAKGAKDQASS